MRLAFLGFGEAASALVEGWGDALPGRIATYDVKLDDPATAAGIRARAAGLGVACADSPEAAVAGADLVFSTVTADRAREAAAAAAPHLAPGAAFLDLNSCAPATKCAAAGIVEAAGGRYLDVAVMAPVHPLRNMVPLLVSGPWAEALAPVLAALPMAPRVVPGAVGRASSIKMIRSVMVKGLEALTAECHHAAEAAGVTAEVMASLDASHPGRGWAGQTAYNLERMRTHGLRRAAEMEAVCQTLRDLGLLDDMSAATVLWQRRLAGTSG